MKTDKGMTQHELETWYESFFKPSIKFENCSHDLIDLMPGFEKCRRCFAILPFSLPLLTFTKWRPYPSQDDMDKWEKEK